MQIEAGYVVRIHLEYVKMFIGLAKIQVSRDEVVERQYAAHRVGNEISGF